MSNKVYYAYNVYVGKFWNGHWFCAKRKDAVPVDAQFWQRYSQLLFFASRNVVLFSPNAKLPKKR